mmetsp:Transcript_2983/g.8642  ORF Transcript_2983/g.8642 Transcript_2983/m.8642 type:complete len:201 (+) Transcript_2983:1853-2455(+)
MHPLLLPRTLARIVPAICTSSSRWYIAACPIWLAASRLVTIKVTSAVVRTACPPRATLISLRCIAPTSVPLKNSHSSSPLTVMDAPTIGNSTSISQISFTAERVPSAGKRLGTSWSTMPKTATFEDATYICSGAMDVSGPPGPCASAEVLSRVEPSPLPPAAPRQTSCAWLLKGSAGEGRGRRGRREPGERRVAARARAG